MQSAATISTSALPPPVPQSGPSPSSSQSRIRASISSSSLPSDGTGSIDDAISRRKHALPEASPSPSAMLKSFIRSVVRLAAAIHASMRMLICAHDITLRIPATRRRHAAIVGGATALPNITLDIAPAPERDTRYRYPFNKTRTQKGKSMMQYNQYGDTRNCTY